MAQQSYGGTRSRHVDAKRLWAGGAATALVAGLAALLCLAIASVVGQRVPEPFSLAISIDTVAVHYVADAVLAGLVATGLMHLLALTTPSPATFFGWVVGLVTATLAVLPFATERELPAQILASATVLVVGVVIGTLLTSVSERAVR